jgi:hypothetical protein
MKTSIALFSVVFLAGSNICFAQDSDNPATQWQRAYKQANDVFLAARKVYDGGNAPPTCAAALRNHFENGQKVKQFIDDALNNVNEMGGMQNPQAKAYFGTVLRTASSEIVALDSDTELSCGLR